MSRAHFAAVILAGGQSSRMGEDKALLQLSGESMLARCQRLAENIGSKQVFVSRNEFKAGFLPDIYPGFGPLSGIHAAIFETELPLLVLPVDMPLVDEDMLLEVVTAGLAMQTCVQFENNELPLFVPNRKEVRSYLEKCLSVDVKDKGRFSIKRFLTAIGSAQLTTPYEEKLVNANTPQQWQHCNTLQRIMKLANKS